MTKRTLPASFDEMCERYGVRARSSLLIRELKHKREDRGNKARALHDTATRGGKDMSSSDKREFERLMDERDQLDEMVTQAEEQRVREGEALDGDGRGRGGRRDAPGVRFHTEDGRTLPGVEPGQSFARIVSGGLLQGGERNGPDTGTSDLSLGRAVLGMIRGDTRMMEREMRAQTVGIAPEGGFFVTPELGNPFIDQARARSVIVEAGAITIPLGAGETNILRVTGDPVAAWKKELGALNETDVTFGTVNMYPKVLGAVIDISEELIEDGANAPQQIEATLAASVANAMDRSFFRGTSFGEGGNDIAGRYFTGVLDDPDVNTVDMSGSAPADYDELIDAMQEVEDANGMADVRIESPRTAAQLSKLKETDTGAYLMPPPTVAALRHLKSTQVPVDLGSGGDESVSVIGNFRSAFVIIGTRSTFRVEVSREAGDAWENLGRKVRVWGRADMAIGRPSHLSLIEAIGAS